MAGQSGELGSRGRRSLLSVTQGPRSTYLHQGVGVGIVKTRVVRRGCGPDRINRRRGMKAQRLLVSLTILNMGLLVFLLTQLRPVPAEARDVAPVLRGRALEIVDERGKVRASIQIFPENPSYRTEDGKPYPETVLLRMSDRNGHPGVKIQATVEGGGVGLGGASDPTYVRLGAKGDKTMLSLTDRDGRTREIAP
jgi:hypothetical protein